MMLIHRVSVTMNMKRCETSFNIRYGTSKRDRVCKESRITKRKAVDVGVERGGVGMVMSKQGTSLIKLNN